ncbi:MAG: 3-deoxy-manno-octulosonate cytidylyltransferase [Francisella sp.]
MTNIHIIIPARLKSTRLPGKMLVDIAGKPMIQRVYEQVSKSKFKNITIATDSDEIKKIAENFGANIILTREDHTSGTDRIAEAVTKLGLADEDIVVNVQGDEPLIPIENIEQVAQLLINKVDASVSTLCEKITKAEDIYNPNNVKVVFDKNNYALYFSRAPIPFERGFSENKQVNKAEFFRHIGIYTYRVSFLKEYAKLKASPLEQYESLEQLRALYNGYKIAVAEAIKPTPTGVDTLQDLEKVRKLFNVSTR